MSTKKVYAVVLYDQATEELGKLISLWLKRSDFGSYIYAKTIEPNGAYFRMIIEDKTFNGEVVEFELQLPHSFIKAVFYSSDVKKIGFL